MPLIKDHAVADDVWQDVTDDGAVATDGPIIVTLDQWNEFRNLLTGRNAPLGILLHSNQPPDLIEDFIDRFKLIAIEFPVLQDGRGFSYARLLRERHGFRGELRAVGQVLQDQLYFMQRCGFNSYQLPENRNVADAIRAFDEFSVAYQSAADDIIPAARKRHHRG